LHHEFFPAGTMIHAWYQRPFAPRILPSRNYDSRLISAPGHALTLYTS